MSDPSHSVHKGYRIPEMREVLKRAKVMVVDDMRAARLLVSNLLCQYGVKALEAECAEQALEIAKNENIDAFVIDIRMPGMNGIELCRAIRKAGKYRDTPIVFITTLDERESLQQALDAGGDDFIHKPVHAAILKARLSNLLQKVAYLKQVESMSLSLRRYVSPRTEEMARAYAASGVLPAPREQEVCVLFSDVRGFTELSQELEPENLLHVLSEHLAAQVDLIYQHGGYVDKFAGDGVMAVFDGEDMALKCCLCALDMLEVSRRHVEQEGLKIHLLGIGIHKGTAIIGNLGSLEHMDYTLVGKTVNLAARLCGMAERLSIVVSQEVRDALADDPRLSFLSERRATLRGFKEPLSIFELARGTHSK